MKKYTLRHRLSYWFDNLMTRGYIMHILWLFIAAGVMIFFIAFIARFTSDGRDVPITRLAWMGLMRTLDAGTMGGDEGSWPYLGLMFLITMGGVFIVGTLIGIITNGIDEKLTELRKGRSQVVEQDHTVILGWSPQIFAIISELVIANQNRKRACIAILGTEDKVVMQDELANRFEDTASTHVVCRTGNPIDPGDLQIVSPDTARSVIILAPEGEDPDSHVIKTLLALSNGPQYAGALFHIVAEIRHARNMEVAHFVGRERAHLIQTDDLIAHITAQTCRQSGLSVVYNELLDFGGDEIYFQQEPALDGKTFGEALLYYEDSALIGLKFADDRISLNPPMGTPIGSGDQVIAISADDDTIHISQLTKIPINETAIRIPVPVERKPEQTIVLGWNRRGPAILKELDQYVPAGSEVRVLADLEPNDFEESCQCAGLQNQPVAFEQADTTDRRTLDALNIHGYDHVILLGYSDNLDHQQADARTLVTLLHLRDISDKFGHPFSLVSEMMDVRNCNLAEVARADDFIVGDHLISLLLSQISENPRLDAVFQDLFDPDGSEIYLLPAQNYVQTDTPVNFYTVVESARRCGQVALGYRLASETEQLPAYGVHLNPKKSEMIPFTARDKIILLAEGEN
jgi:hypothetical protein